MRESGSEPGSDSTSPRDGTRVRLEHGGWAEGSEDVRATYTHWDQLLERFAAHVS